MTRGYPSGEMVMKNAYVYRLPLPLNRNRTVSSIDAIAAEIGKIVVTKTRMRQNSSINQRVNHDCAVLIIIRDRCRHE